MDPERAPDALDDMTEAELIVFAWERGLTVRGNQVVRYRGNRTTIGCTRCLFFALRYDKVSTLLYCVSPSSMGMTITYTRQLGQQRENGMFYRHNMATCR